MPPKPPVFRLHARENSDRRGYTRRWNRASKRFLAGKFCVHCEAAGRVRLATETDHIVPHNGNLVLFWDPENWQPLCKSCHSVKTARENS